MTITLRPEKEKLVAQAMQTGAYQNADEVIERALRMLHSDEDWLLDHKAEITEKSSAPSGSLTAVNSSRPRNRKPAWKKRKAARLRERP